MARKKNTRKSSSRTQYYKEYRISDPYEFDKWQQEQWQSYKKFHRDNFDDYYELRNTRDVPDQSTESTQTKNIQRRAKTSTPRYSPVQIALNYFNPCQARKRATRHYALRKLQQFGPGSIAKRTATNIICKGKK